MQTTAQGRWIGGQSFNLMLAMIAIATVASAIIAATLLDDEDTGSTGGRVTSPQQQSFQSANSRFQDMNLMPETAQVAPAPRAAVPRYEHHQHRFFEQNGLFSGTQSVGIPVEHGQPY